MGCGFLFDADGLDAQGSVELARLFYAGIGACTSDKHTGTQRDLNDRAYALDHIEVKLATLPATMQTVAGRAMGEERLEWLRQFRETFISE